MSKKALKICKVLLCVSVLLTLVYCPSNGLAKINHRDLGEYTIVDNPFNKSILGQLVDKAYELKDMQLGTASIEAVNPITISADSTWTVDKSPYYVNGEVKILNGATLTINAGVQVLLENTLVDENKSGFIVDGKLVISGTDLNKVILKPADATAASGSWKGIYVTDIGQADINNAVIDRAGSWTKNGVYSLGNLSIKNSTISNTDGNGILAFSKVTVSNCIISNNIGYGLDIYKNLKSTDIEITNNKFLNNVTAGRLVYREAVSSSFIVGGNLAEGNKTDGFKLYGDILGEMTFTKLGVKVPYVLVNRGDLYDVPEYFTINKNSKVTFDKSIVKIEAVGVNYRKNKIIVNGILNLNGTSTEHTILTSLKDASICGDTANFGVNAVPAMYDWDDILVREGGLLNTNYADVNYGTTGIVAYGNAFVNNSSFNNNFSAIYGNDNVLAITNSSFNNLADYGFLYNSLNKNSDLKVQNNSFSGVKNFLGKITLYNSGGSKLLVGSNISTNNTKSGVELIGNLSYDTTINSFGTEIPYVIRSLKIDKNVTANLSAGTVFKMENGTILGKKTNLLCYGTLNANGTSTSKIIVTSLRDDSICGDTNGDKATTKPIAGDWGSIAFLGDKDTSIPSIINNTLIDYGGDAEKGYALGGNGSVQFLNSIIQNSSEDGIKSSGKIVVKASVIQNNSKIGLNLTSVDGFNAVIENNNFVGNSDYAAFGSFNAASDNLTVANNTAVNNKLNGFGVSGVIISDFAFTPAGGNIPYIIPTSLKVVGGKTLTLNPGVVIKGMLSSTLNIDGKINAVGTTEQRVFLTSIKDDSVGGDTENDGNKTSPSYKDWNGIVYNANSEGDFNNFQCDYAFYNMDYKNIPHLKVVSKGNDNVSINDRNGLLIKNSEGGKAVILHQFDTGIQNILAVNNNIKRNPMIYGNFAAWIEADSRICIYNLETKTITPMEAPGISSMFLNNGYIVWTSNGSLTYKNLITGNGGDIKDVVDASFTPVISPEYLIYKNIDGMVHKVELKKDNREYYMISNRTEQESMDMYNENIAFLSKNPLEQVRNITVGDIPSWTAIEATASYTNDNSNIALYKNRIMFYNKGIKASLVIAESDGQKSLMSSPEFTSGYNIKGNDIGENVAAFTDEKFVYLTNTKFSTTAEKFITGSLSDKKGYTRKIDLGTTLSAKIGGEIGLSTGETPIKDDITGAGVTGGISFSASKTGTFSYIINTSSQDIPLEIGIGRELVKQAGLESEVKAEVGLGKVAGVSGSIGAAISGLTKNSDEYYFDSNTPETYKKIGLLTAGGLVRYSEADGLASYNIFWEIAKKIIASKLDNLSNAQNSSLSYNSSSGRGVNYSAGTKAALNVGKLQAGIENSLSAEGLAEVGRQREGLITNKYVNMKSSYSLNDFKISVGYDDATLAVSASVKLPVFNTKFTISTKMKDNNELVITFNDTQKDKQGYIKSYAFTVKGADLEYAKHHNMLKNITDLEGNLKNLNGTDLSLLSYAWSASQSITEVIDDLVELMNNAEDLDYKINISKADSKSLSIAVDTIGTPTNGVKPTGGLGIQGQYSDEISLEVDSGKIIKGRVANPNVVVAFIPVKNTKARELLINIFTNFASEINPSTVPYINNKVSYKNNDIDEAQIFAPFVNNLSKALFIVTQNINDTTNTSFKIDDNQSIIKDSIYMESKDTSGNKITSYPVGSQLKMFIGSKFQDMYKDNYAIYEYNSNERKWIRLGGKIDAVEKSVTIPISHNGQYAVGTDLSQPDIKWTYDVDKKILNNNVDLKIGKAIYASIIDKDIIDSSKVSVVVKDSLGLVIQNPNYNYNGSNKQITYYVSGTVNTSYTIFITYTDIYGNQYSSSRTFRIVDGVVNAMNLELWNRPYNTKAGDEFFESDLDFNKDNIIDVFDLVNMSK